MVSICFGAELIKLILTSITTLPEPVIIFFHGEIEISLFFISKIIAGMDLCLIYNVAQLGSLSMYFVLFFISQNQEEENQINGIIMIMDLKGLNWKIAKNVSPFYAKRIMSLLQVCWSK